LCLRFKGTILLAGEWEGRAPKSPSPFTFQIFFHFIVVLGFKGKTSYEEPLKIPSNFIFQKNYKN